MGVIKRRYWWCGPEERFGGSVTEVPVRILQKGLLAGPHRDLWCTAFLEELLADTQIVIEPCSFRTGAIPIPLLHAASSCTPWPGDSVSLSFDILGGPAQLSSVPWGWRGRVEQGQRECCPELELLDPLQAQLQFLSNYKWCISQN